MGNKILHISHHIGCFRDQQYILEKLGFEVHNYKFQDNVFTITKTISETFWNNNLEYINSFDYILISDTAPLSRPFLTHLDRLKPKLIIWICNRFDFGMQQETEYYQLLKQHCNNKNVRVIPSTFFEKMWCLQHGINLMFTEVINPLGKHTIEQENKIPQAEIYNQWYGRAETLPDADIFVPFYRNDNVFIPLANVLKHLGLNVYNGTFFQVQQLRQYKSVVTLPDTFCKWLSFELIHNNIPAVLPSRKFLLELSKQSNYLFNITGYGGAELLTDDLIKLSEWYNPDFVNCRLYFDKFEDIPSIVNNIGPCNFTKESNNHEKTILSKWKKVYESF